MPYFLHVVPVGSDSGFDGGVKVALFGLSFIARRSEGHHELGKRSIEVQEDGLTRHSRTVRGMSWRRW